MREMGRAMMGTGEASGSGRALQAAEAAIANPLLDETSMKGAQGLLISITGGRDLTLFEVDEAATRIREEVDPDANIILGATFDESLEGIIRVSVVATGIDRAMNEAAERNLQPAARPAIRPSAAVAPAAAAVQPAPVMQAPKVVDPIAQTIREAEMERELEFPAPRASAPVQQPVVQQETFRPQSKIFAPAPEAPVTRPQVQQQAPAPVMSAVSGCAMRGIGNRAGRVFKCYPSVRCSACRILARKPAPTSLIPVPVTGIQCAQVLGRRRLFFGARESMSAQTRGGWIPVTGTGMRVERSAVRLYVSGVRLRTAADWGRAIFATRQILPLFSSGNFALKTMQISGQILWSAVPCRGRA